MRTPIGAVVVAVVAAACGGGRSADRRVIGSVPAAANGGDDGSTAIAPAGGLQRALAAMPADYEVVFGLDATKLRASRLYATYEPMLRQGVASVLVAFDELCGFDVMNTATGMLLGGKGMNLEHGTVFLSGLDRADLARCFEGRASAARAAGGTPSVSFDGDYFAYSHGDDAMQMLALAPRSAMWIKHGTELGDAAELQAAARARDGAGLTGSPAFLDLLGRTRTDAALWFLIRGNSPFLGLGGLIEVSAIRAAFDAGEVVTGELRLTLLDDATARTKTDEANQQLAQLAAPPFGALLTGIRITADGRDLVIAMTFSGEQLEGITALVRQAGVLP